MTALYCWSLWNRSTPERTNQHREQLLQRVTPFGDRLLFDEGLVVGQHSHGCCYRDIRYIAGRSISSNRKNKEPIITENWRDILRSAATMVAGAMPQSRLLRKFSAYPRL